MSGGTTSPAPYDLEYSGRVRDRLFELGVEARAAGYGETFLTALREFDRRLKVYPQFGHPLVDLQAEPGHIRLGVVSPLTMRYAVYEERRRVFVGALPVLLRRRSAG